VGGRRQVAGHSNLIAELKIDQLEVMIAELKLDQLGVMIAELKIDQLGVRKGCLRPPKLHWHSMLIAGLNLSL